MRRAELILLACAALGGCMKIYPDPELPDLEVSWSEIDCREGTGDVVVAVAGVDDPTDVLDARVPCTDAQVELPDVARERFHVTGTLLDAAGAPFAVWESDADLRDGISERVSLFLGGGSNVRVGWVFDMGASCESLGVFTVGALFRSPDAPGPFTMSSLCSSGAVFASLPGGMFTVELRARTVEGIVAASQPMDFEVASSGLTNVGPLTLSPCGAACPSPGATLQP